MGKQLKTGLGYLKDFISVSGSYDDTNEENLTAIAEAYFRLALHTSTEPEDALVYLKKGYKIDNIDPRFAYHIARIYFQRKEFDQARKWLMTAFNHCPTSHRIWVHIALLQNELNLEFNKKNQYRKDELKEKALVINEKVIGKSDSIDISLLKFEPSKADKGSEIQIDSSAFQDNIPSDPAKNLSLDSVRSFILEMLKRHSELLQTASVNEVPEKLLNSLDHVNKMLTEYGEKTNHHIETELGFVCRQAEREFDIRYILTIYKLFYFYLHTLLKINILRRKIKDKALNSIRSISNGNNQESGINSSLKEILENKFNSLDITTGRKSMELLEVEIDNSMNKLKSIRKIDKNKCRWLGVFDLSIENYLNNDASSLYMEKLIPLMEEVAGLIEKRHNGRSALAILCTEWLISGYSPQSIKRIVADLEKKSDDEFVAFIELLSSLFECEPEELPELLSVHLKNQNITPLLAVLILKKRYLWREIDFEKNFEFKKSVQILNGHTKNKDSITDESEVNQNIKMLLDGLSGMWNPRKIPLLVQDPKTNASESRSYSYEETCIIIDRLENGIREYNILTEKLQDKFLKDFRTKYTAISTPGDYAYVLKQYKILQKLEDIYASFVKDAKELQKDLMSGLRKDIDNNLKKILSDREAHLTSELNDLKGCPQILKNIEKNLVANSSLNENHKEPEAADQNLEAILREAGDLFASVFLKSNGEEHAATGFNVFDRFKELEKLGFELHKSIEDLQVQFLKDFRTKCNKIETQDEYSYVLYGLEYLKKINVAISGITKDSLSEIERLSGEFKDADEGKKRDFISAREKIVNTFRDIESMCPKPDKYESRVVASGNKFEKRPAGSDKILADIYTNIQKISKDLAINSDGQQSSRDSDGKQNGKKAFYDKIGARKSEELAAYKSELNGLSAIEGLEKTVNLVDREIEDLLNYSLESFQYFDESILQNPYIIDLQIHYLNQTAETYFRLGYYKKAIRFWNKIILLKEIDPASSRNIAIAETMIDQNDQKILEAWRKYCEELYRCDTITGNPRKYASERAEIHSKISSVYAPFLSKTKEIRQHDPEEYQEYQQQFIALINNPAQFYEYMIHKIAELFNRRFTFKSPVLFLGLQINADDHAVNRASAKMEVFIRSVCSVLPDKVKPLFLDLCLNHLKRSKEFCLAGDNMSLAKNPSYEEDKKKLQDWIKAVLELKEILFLLLRDCQNTDDDLRYIDTVFIIDLINKLPIDIDKGILEDMSVSTYAIYRDSNPAELPKVFASNIVHLPLIPFIKKITAAEDPSGKKIYKQLTRILSDGSLYLVDREAELIGLIDYPGNFLPDFVIGFLKQKDRSLDSEKSKQVLKYLKDKCEQFPLISAFPRLFSGIDYNSGKVFLEKAIGNALNRKIRLGCKKDFENGGLNSDLNSVKNLFANQQFEDALKLFGNLFDKYYDKITIPEESIINDDTFPEETKNDLLLIADLYYKDLQEIERLLRTDLGIIDEALLKNIMTLAKDADAPFLPTLLSNTLAGWTNSNPGKAKDHLEEFCRYWVKLREKLLDQHEEEKNNLINNMDQLLIKASIASLGNVDNEDKTAKAVSLMENLILFDGKNYYAMYYMALFKRNLGGFIAKRSGIDNAKEYYREAFTITSELKTMEASLDDNLKNQIDQLFDSLNENKDMFLN